MKTYELKFSPELDQHDQRKLLCPVCGFDYNHVEPPHFILGHDGGAAGWEGRGDLAVIPMWCEAGHHFEVCFGFHKGQTFAFCRTNGETKKD